MQFMSSDDIIHFGNNRKYFKGMLLHQVSFKVVIIYVFWVFSTKQYSLNKIPFFNFESGQIEGKRDHDQEKEMLAFICEMTGEEIDMEHPEPLKDGRVLCK